MNNDASGLGNTIEPKSDQLNADDLIVGPITVKIIGVRRGTADQPVEITIEGHRPYRPCKSMRRVLIAAWGDNGHEWVGKSMTLYCDPSVKWGGVAIGGIRISHLSDIEDKLSLMLTTTRAKRMAYTIEELKIAQPTTYPDDQFEANLPQWRNVISSGRMSADEVIARAQEKGKLSERQIASIRA